MVVGDSYIRSICMLGLDDVVAARGVEFKALLEEAGLPAASMSNIDELIPFRKYVALLENAAQRTGHPNIALDWAQRSGPEYAYLGPIILMSKFVSTIGEWADTALRYWHYHTNGFTMRITAPEDSSSAIIRFHSDAFIYPARQIFEHAIASVIGAARTVGDMPEANARFIRFQHRKPADITLHEAFFRCPLEFGSEYTEIEIDREHLSHGTNGGLRLFKPLMAFYVGERIKRMNFYDQSTSTAVALAVPSIIGSGNCHIEAVAESFGQHVKQLQRQLAKEGTCFSDILDRVRENMAKQLLRETDAPVSRIAGLLDYASTPPFIAAFHRWAGMSPLQFRQASRGYPTVKASIRASGA